MADIEKVSLNVSVVDLGQIDLLTEQGFYSSRTDFLRAAIRTQLAQHADELKQTVTRKSALMGVLLCSRAKLEQYRAEGTMMEIIVVGMVVLADDIPAELAQATIASVKVYGVLKASPEVKAALADRIN